MFKSARFWVSHVSTRFEGQFQHHHQQQHHQQQHAPPTPRYIPGGGDRSSFVSPPPPSPFSPPGTPPANGGGGGQFSSTPAQWETPQPQAPPPAPPLPHGANRRQVSYQGSRGVTLSFNYWVGRALSNQVLTSSVRELVVSTLAGEQAPEFVEKVPGADKVVIACVSGLGMAKAEMSMAEEGACPFLSSCSSVPVRHSLEAGRARSAPRVSDVQPGAALMMWGEKPTVPIEEIAAMSLIEVFRDCEVTFAGSKSPGWKDDVTFLPSSSSASSETHPPTSKPEPAGGGDGVGEGGTEEGDPGPAATGGEEGQVGIETPTGRKKAAARHSSGSRRRPARESSGGTRTVTAGGTPWR
ncbi:unnamed protein product [Ectocarpus sp. 12 AP-2014]